MERNSTLHQKTPSLTKSLKKEKENQKVGCQYFHMQATLRLNGRLK
jgi:hypothetical protein